MLSRRQHYSTPRDPVGSSPFGGSTVSPRDRRIDEEYLMSSEEENLHQSELHQSEKAPQYFQPALPAEQQRGLKKKVSQEVQAVSAAPQCRRLALWRSGINIFWLLAEQCNELVLIDVCWGQVMDAMFKAVHSKRAARQLFRKIDKNGDGQLSVTELRVALRHLGVRNLSAKQTHEVMRALDCDGDELIDSDEFIEQLFKLKVSRLTKKLQAASYVYGGKDYGKLFRQYDRDNSGEIGWEEFRLVVRKEAKITAAMMTEQEVRELFRYVDESGDGSISLEEFVALFQGEDLERIHQQEKRFSRRSPRTLEESERQEAEATRVAEVKAAQAVAEFDKLQAQLSKMMAQLQAQKAQLDRLTA
jgi:Ca2+-binding EF-hand superfamily protein